jgi:hypothetical protein
MLEDTMASIKTRLAAVCMGLSALGAQVIAQAADPPANNTEASDPQSQCNSKSQSASTPQTLKSFGVSGSGDSQLATAEIAQTVFPILVGKETHFVSTDPAGSLYPYQGIGVHLTAAAPIQNATFTDYARQELLGRNTGMINGYISLFAGRKTKTGDRCAYEWGARKTTLDHIYFAIVGEGWHLPRRVSNASDTTSAKTSQSDATPNAVEPNQGLLFLSHGLGPRAIKTSLSGSGELAAAGTAYVGLGIDGPLFDLGNLSNAGGLSLEVYASTNYMNHGALEKMFNVSHAPSTFNTFGVSLKAYVTSRFSINLDYGKGLGSFGSTYLKDATILSFGYNTDSGSSQSSSTQPGDSAAPPAPQK